MGRKWVIGTVAAAAAAILIAGVVLAMTQEERTTAAMMRYLEGKYGERFEVEFFDKGDMLFPDLYGDDKMMVHPAGKRDIPFYVFKDGTPSGFSDSYVRSYFSVQYTEKYKQDIMAMSLRRSSVKFDLASGDWPDEAEVMKQSVDEVVADPKNKINLIMHLAIEYNEEEVDIEQEADFLYSLYTYMEEKRNEGEQVILAVAYVYSDHFPEATEILRISHAINFSWDVLGEEKVVKSMYFGTGNDIQNPDYFYKFAQ